MTALLVQWLVTGAAVAGVATLAAWLMPPGAAAQRHLVWWGALVAVMLLPLAPVLALVPAGSPMASDVSAGRETTAVFRVLEPPAWLAVLAVAVWACTVALACVRLGVGVWTLRQLSSSARPIDPALLAESFRRARPVRGARVWVSPLVHGACAIGFAHPRILVSSRLVEQLRPEMLETIILHERAHLERYDDWTRLAQRLILAVAGLHPAVQWICRQIDLECEAACDQRVVDCTRAPLAYATSLAAAAEVATGSAGQHHVLAPGASVSGGGLHDRVSRLVHAAPVRPWVQWAGSVAGLGVVGLASVITATMPPLVVFGAIEQSLATLASLPMPSAIVPVVTPSRPMTVEGGRAERAVAVSAERPALVSGGEARQPQASAPADAPPGQPAAAQIAAVEPDALTPRTLRPLVVADPGSAPEISRAGRLGGSATRAGAAAANRAATAGHSISRFFRSGGHAVSDAF